MGDRPFWSIFIHLYLHSFPWCLRKDNSSSSLSRRFPLLESDHRLCTRAWLPGSWSLHEFSQRHNPQSTSKVSGKVYQWIISLRHISRLSTFQPFQSTVDIIGNPFRMDHVCSTKKLIRVRFRWFFKKTMLGGVSENRSPRQCHPQYESFMGSGGITWPTVSFNFFRFQRDPQRRAIRMISRDSNTPSPISPFHNFLLVGGLEHFYFSISLEWSSQLTNSFQRGWNHQPVYIFWML